MMLLNGIEWQQSKGILLRNMTLGIAILMALVCKNHKRKLLNGFVKPQYKGMRKLRIICVNRVCDRKQSWFL